MTNAVWNSIEEMDDVRAKGMYQEALEQKQDPQKVLEYFGELGRDNARTPMQWCDEKNAGFTEGTPWLKVNENYQGINVKAQEARDDSLLAFYRRLTALRHQEPYASVFAEGTVRPVMEELPAVIALGTLFGWLGSYMVFSLYGDTVFPFEWATNGVVLGVAALAALLASVAPARRAVKTPPVEALAEA